MRCFSIRLQKICYIEVEQNGTIKQIDHTFSEASKAYHNAVSGKSKIYAVWPGNYKSDLFEIDDLSLFADAFGIERPDKHSHKIEWKLSSIDDGKSMYAHVEITFLCDCELTFSNIKAFAADMKQQYGWDVATSKGISGYGKNYIISVRRNSL